MTNPTSTPKATDAMEAILRARESGDMDAAGTIEDLVELIDRITSSDEGDGLREALIAIRTACNFGVNAPGQALAYVDELAEAALATKTALLSHIDTDDG